MNRRGFLKSMLVAGTAPAIVRADSLMRIIPRETEIITSGFGMAGIKTEGTELVYDSRYGLLLWPGIQAWWGHQYREFPANWNNLPRDLLTGEDQ